MNIVGSSQKSDNAFLAHKCSKRDVKVLAAINMTNTLANKGMEYSTMYNTT